MDQQGGTRTSARVPRIVVESGDPQLARAVAQSLSEASGAAQVTATSFPSETMQIQRTDEPDVVMVDCRASRAIGPSSAPHLPSSDTVCVLLTERGTPPAGMPAGFSPLDCIAMADVTGPSLARVLALIVTRKRAERGATSEIGAYKRRIADLEDEARTRAEREQVASTGPVDPRTEAIEQLVVTIRHEINNPLATLVGRAQLLRMRGRNAPPEVTNALVEIEREALRIRSLMDRLDLARDGRTTGCLDGRRIKLD